MSLGCWRPALFGALSLVLSSAGAGAGATVGARAGASAIAGASGTAALRAAADRTLAADPSQDRAGHLAQGEAALRRGDAGAAERFFSLAAAIAHSADTEMALVRAYMQAGQYRRALAFSAHTAGAHLDEVAGASLYSWLLHAGGQEAVAARLLAVAKARAQPPREALMAAVDAQLRSPAPRAQGELLQPPARLAPYSHGDAPGRAAGVVASGTLVGNGDLALAPAAALKPLSRYWVRNGLGQVVPARVLRVDRVHGVALLRLARVLPTGAVGAVGAVGAAPADAFPGSMAHALHYALATDAEPAWPQLRTGFIGAAGADEGGRELGVGLPAGAARGGPVFDTSGRLLGVAIAAAGADRLVAVSQLRRAFGGEVVIAAAGTAQKQTPDAIYEPALLLTLQIIRSPAAR